MREENLLVITQITQVDDLQNGLKRAGAQFH